MRLLFVVSLLLFSACDSPKPSAESHSGEASDSGLEAVRRYRKLEAEGKLPTPEEQAESLRVLKSKMKASFDKLRLNIREAERACREKENDTEAYKACLKESEPLIFSDGKERDECITAGKTNCP